MSLQNFGLTIDNTAAYTPKQTEEFLATALLTGETKSLVRQVVNVKNSYKVPYFNWGSILTEDSCDFTPTGTGTLTSKTISVCSLAVQVTMCQKDLEDSMLADSMRPGSNHADLPTRFQDFVLDLMAKKINAQLEDLFWNGDTEASPASLCDGILKQLLADSAVVDVAGVSAVTLSASNIIGEIGKVYSAIPNTIKHNAGIVIFLSPAAAGFYKQATAALTGNTNAGYVGDKELNYLGTRLVVAPGIPTNTMVGCDPQNLILATDLISDIEDVQLIDMSMLGEKNVRFRASFKWGVSYGLGSEIVYYKGA